MPRPLTPADGSALLALRREALTASPLAFGSSPEDDRLLAPEDPSPTLGASDDASVFGAFERGVLVGMVGIRRLEKRKERHRAGIWGMFVTPTARGRGKGAALLAAAIEWARTRPGIVQVELSVTDAAPEALRLYERAGFRPWGVQPRALRAEGREVDEHHLVLALPGVFRDPA